MDNKVQIDSFISNNLEKKLDDLNKENIMLKEQIKKEKESFLLLKNSYEKKIVSIEEFYSSEIRYLNKEKLNIINIYEKKILNIMEDKVKIKEDFKKNLNLLKYKEILEESRNQIEQSNSKINWLKINNNDLLTENEKLKSEISIIKSKLEVGKGDPVIDSEFRNLNNQDDIYFKYFILNLEIRRLRKFNIF